MSKPVILTGLRANNDLHIGNYFGALLPLIDMAKNHADDYEINLFVPDLHSFTTPIDHNQLHDQILHNVRLFAAAGLPLDHPNIHIYRQSYVPAHSELTWILDCFTGFGQMSRMTQFKDKSKNYDIANDTLRDIRRLNDLRGEDLKSLDITNSKINGKDVDKGVIEQYLRLFNSLNAIGDVQEPSVGLFNYPVLMAADILLYGASYVPVGDDQSQHLEFARDIAQRMNSKFEQELFVIPEEVKKQHEFFGKEQGLRIKDLGNPTKKMSKSDESGKGVIFLGDEPEMAAKKIKSAATDSFSKIDLATQDQPGIKNLLQILSLATGDDLAEVTAAYAGQEQYGPLKVAVADAVSTFLTDFQTRLAKVDDRKLLAKLEADEAQMNAQANATLLKVQKAVGLRA